MFRISKVRELLSFATRGFKILSYYFEKVKLTLGSIKGKILAEIFVKTKFNNKPIELHIGCGTQRLDGYINIDKYKTSGAQINTSADKLSFGNNSVDEIYTSHMIEHLTLDEFNAALNEWYRVLRVGGKVEIRCPNFELYVREWLNGDETYRWGWGIIKRAITSL